MMYFELYQSVKKLVAQGFGLTLDADTGKVIPSPDAELQDIKWFNNQYEGTILTAPVLFIEFSPLVINRRTKQTNTTDITIRLHVVSKIVVDSDGDIPDTDVFRHESLAYRVLSLVEDVSLPFLEGMTRSLRVAGWEHSYKYKGWMVTLIDLKTKG